MTGWTSDEVHLLTHAAAMGGWLSSSYADRYKLAAQRLETGGLAERAQVNEGRTSIWRLTEAGRREAEGLS